MKDLPMFKKSHDIVNRIHVGEGGVERILLYYLHTLVLKIIAEKFVPGEKIRVEGEGDLSSELLRELRFMTKIIIPMIHDQAKDEMNFYNNLLAFLRPIDSLQISTKFVKSVLDEYREEEKSKKRKNSQMLEKLEAIIKKIEVVDLN